MSRLKIRTLTNIIAIGELRLSHFQHYNFVSIYYKWLTTVVNRKQVDAQSGQKRISAIISAIISENKHLEKADV